jgi:hypothetical protein
MDLPVWKLPVRVQLNGSVHRRELFSVKKFPVKAIGHSTALFLVDRFADLGKILSKNQGLYGFWTV